MRSQSNQRIEATRLLGRQARASCVTAMMKQNDTGGGPPAPSRWVEDLWSRPSPAGKPAEIKRLFFGSAKMMMVRTSRS
jgi:hypothetical protein